MGIAIPSKRPYHRIHDEQVTLKPDVCWAMPHLEEREWKGGKNGKRWRRISRGGMERGGGKREGELGQSEDCKKR